MAWGGGIGNTSAMASMPPPTLYHRWVGWHAPALRRAAVMAAVGLVVTAVLQQVVTLWMAAIAGWDAAALTFLVISWAIILRADGTHTRQLAVREDVTRGLAAVLLVGASVVSLVGAGFTLRLAGQESGPPRDLLVGVAVLTVMLSWAVINTVYTLRYADMHYGLAGPGIAFGGGSGRDQPAYRDFAYVAFTIGMTYQVSDTTVCDPRIRRAVFSHALLAYLFSVVIIGGAVNVIAGLLR
jgi:uncharacterized membrane protein